MQTPHNKPKHDQTSATQHGSVPSNDEPLEEKHSSHEPDDDTQDFGGFPKDAPDMKRFLGCGG